MKALTLATVLIFMLSTGSFAGEREIKAGLKSLTGNDIPVKAIVKSPINGLSEVTVADGTVLLITDDGRYLVQGDVIDTASTRNLSEAKRNKLSQIDFASLPLAQAIKQVRGDGSRVLATFEDPNCGYCKKFNKDIATMDNVTIYTFLYPILGQDSVDKAKSIWCADDRAKTWNAWMRDGTAIETRTNCETPIEKNIALGQKLKVNGTPNIFVKSGQRIPGALPREVIEKAATEGKFER